MTVDLRSGYNGWITLRNGYRCFVHVDGDQDRENAYLVSDHPSFWIGHASFHGLYTRDGRSWWDQPGNANVAQSRVIPIEREVVAFEPFEWRITLSKENAQ